MALDPAELDFTDSTAHKAFRRLLDKPEPFAVASLAAAIGSDEQRVADAFAALKSAGRAEFDEQDRLLGIYGLTLKPTEHRLVIGGKTFFVWCAFDSVGIPAALGESATVTSVCAQCGRELELMINDGQPPSLPLVISWLPQRCDSVRDEFCPTVNFYCDADHYRASLDGCGPTEAFLTLEKAASLGRDNWGWAARAPDR